MKNYVLVLLAIAALNVGAHAQNNELNKKPGMGFQLVQYQNDFGLGLNMTSPYFLHDRLAVRIKANMIWNQHINATNETTSTNYTNASVGVVVFAGNVGERIRAYGEGGILFIQPSDVFSTENAELGGYGLFGFEFFMSNHTNYFIELGGVGTGAIADKVIAKPIYSNGFLISAGFRFQL